MQQLESCDTQYQECALDPDEFRNYGIDPNQKQTQYTKAITELPSNLVAILMSIVYMIVEPLTLRELRKKVKNQCKQTKRTVKSKYRQVKKIAMCGKKDRANRGIRKVKKGSDSQSNYECNDIESNGAQMGSSHIGMIESLSEYYGNISNDGLSLNIKEEDENDHKMKFITDRDTSDSSSDEEQEDKYQYWPTEYIQSISKQNRLFST
eukprot:403359418